MIMSPSPSAHPPLPHQRAVKRLVLEERVRSRSLHGVERKALIGRRDSSVDSTEGYAVGCGDDGFTYSRGRSLNTGRCVPEQGLSSSLPTKATTCDYSIGCQGNSSTCASNSGNAAGGELNLRAPVLRTVRRAVSLLKKTLTDSLTSLGSYTSSTESLQEQATYRGPNKAVITQGLTTSGSSIGMHASGSSSGVSISTPHTSTVKVFIVDVMIIICVVNGYYDRLHYLCKNEE